MNNYNPDIHHRRSIRLKGYDYSQAGLYFITICVQNRDRLFGKIISESDDHKTMRQYMHLNDAGKMVERWYYELENKFCDIRCHEMIVMPNHFHCIIENTGADLRFAAGDISGESGSGEHVLGEHVGSPLPSGEHVLGEHVGSPLHRVIQWFKTMSTNEYIRGVKNLGWEPFNGKLWQRNYWEHIIRNEQSFYNISQYIINNPAKWNDDKFYRK